MILGRILNLTNSLKNNKNGALKLRQEGAECVFQLMADGSIHRPTEVTKIMGQILSWIKTTQMFYSYTELHQFIPLQKWPVVPD